MDEPNITTDVVTTDVVTTEPVWTLLDEVKLSLRLTTTAYDHQLNGLISAALLDLGLAGVGYNLLHDPFRVARRFRPSEALIRRAEGPAFHRHRVYELGVRRCCSQTRPFSSRKLTRSTR